MALIAWLTVPVPKISAVTLIDGSSAILINRSSHIETTVTPIGGKYLYEYTVVNTSPAPQLLGDRLPIWPSIIGYEIPLDHPDVVENILSPDTWNHRFLSAAEYVLEYGSPNPFNSQYVLQWYDEEFQWQPPAKMIVPDGFNAAFQRLEYEPKASGFSMISTLGPVDGPYANLWVDFERNIGDPPLPGGGLVGGGATVGSPPWVFVPEVPAQGLAALGCLAFALALRRRG